MSQGLLSRQHAQHTETESETESDTESEMVLTRRHARRRMRTLPTAAPLQHGLMRARAPAQDMDELMSCEGTLIAKLPEELVSAAVNEEQAQGQPVGICSADASQEQAEAGHFSSAHSLLHAGEDENSLRDDRALATHHDEVQVEMGGDEEQEGLEEESARSARVRLGLPGEGFEMPALGGSKVRPPALPPHAQCRASR